MKKGLLIAALYFFQLSIHAQMRWDGGGGDGLWSTSANWVTDIVPTINDDVLLDNSFVAGNYSVSLSNGNSSVLIRSLRISPANPYVIILQNPSGNTSPTAFVANGQGDAVTLDKGAIFRNSSGALSGTPVSVSGTNFFRINNGGRYIHNTPRGHTDFLVSRLSTQPGTEQGIFEFDVPGTASYTVSVSGRTYGHIVFSSSAAGSPRIYTASGISPFIINGDFEINPNTTFSYGANTGVITIAGSCIVYNGAIFNISNGANNAIIQVKGNLDNRGLITETGSSLSSRIEMCGITDQQVNSAGSLSQSISFVMNNNAGITLLSMLTLPYHLELLSGKIRTTLSNLLVMADNTTCAGGSTSSFVDGPMRKIGDDDFDFPVGGGSIFAPIGIIGAGGSITDQFTAEYRRTNPQTYPGLNNNYESPIHHISYVEYWMLTRDLGSSAKAIRLSASAYSFVKLMSSLLVSGFANGRWNNYGISNIVNGAPSPPYLTGRFMSAFPVNEFGAFAIATIDNEVQNPLPLGLISFEAVKVNLNKVLLSWEIGEGGPGVYFEIERSSDGRFFTGVAILKSKSGIHIYQYEDNSLPGINWYRLKMTDVTGAINYSRVCLVKNDIQESMILSIGSTSGNAPLLIRVTALGEQLLWVRIFDAQGRMMKQTCQKINSGTTSIPILLNEFVGGIYYISVMTKEGKIKTLSFFRRQ